MTVDTTRDDVRERAFVRSSLHVRERQRTLSLILGARYNIPSTVVDIIIAYDRENTTMALSGAATVIQSYYRASVDVRYAQGLRAASESTIKVATDSNGITTNTLVTPRVASVARDVFNCSSLEGARLENQPTSTGVCYGSHWEQRLFMNEMMASTSSHHAAFSALTLAAMEDSGWYRANYSVATGLIWGRNRGCAFVTGECIINGQAVDGYCDTAGQDGCTPDHRAKGQCNVATYGGALPTEFQHFDDASQGGSLSVTDYCPYYASYSNGECSAAGNVRSRHPTSVGHGTATAKHDDHQSLIQDASLTRNFQIWGTS